MNSQYLKAIRDRTDDDWYFWGGLLIRHPNPTENDIINYAMEMAEIFIEKANIDGGEE